MQYATLIAALAIGAPAMAMPAPAFATEGKFSLSQQSSGTVLKSGPVAYKKALNKYKAAVPLHVASAADAAQSGSVTASPEQYDSSYLVPVTIGSQTVNLDFDTGSADLWVFSTELPSSESSGHTLYDPSSATPLSGATWDISYGDGSGASGNVYADQVVVGPVTATSQAVEAATSVSSEFTQQTDNDGLLGLAFSSINTVSPTQQTTFFDTVSSTLDQPLFAAYLRAGEAGSYDFGYIDDSKYTGSLNTVDVDSSNGFWAFDAGDASAGGSGLGSLGSSIADTGTSLILIDDSIVSAYYSNVDGATNNQNAGGYVFDCGATLPDFTISINGQDATVPGSYISYAPNGDGTCYGGIQSSAGIGFNILGDVFLKSQYVVFNSDGPSLSFAQQA